MPRDEIFRGKRNQRHKNDEQNTRVERESPNCKKKVQKKSIY